LKLVPASLEPPDGLEEFLIELGAGEHGFGGTDFSSGKVALDELLGRLVDMSAGKDLPLSRVPMTTFWLIDDAGCLTGMSRLRHRLNEALINEGGHIGYYVRPAKRREGHGRKLLALTLDEARRLGLLRVLITADSDNLASLLVIEANGGHPEDERKDGERRYKRYWIDLH